MWSMSLAESESDLTVIPVNPRSLLNTNMVKEGWGFHRSSADKGANILYDLAIAEKYASVLGQYFDNDLVGFGSVHPAAQEKEAIKTLIEKTDELVDKVTRI